MSETDFSGRLEFHEDLQVMEVDFSDMTFDKPAMVHSVYDEIDRQLADTGKKWFFLVNYRNCNVMTEAWIAFAHRGKDVNLAYSLGSVRFAATGDTSEAILDSSKEEKFDPNLFASRDAALVFIGEMRSKISPEEIDAKRKPSLPEDDRSLAQRVSFHDDLQIMEVDFSNVTFAKSADVNQFYDEIARQLGEKDQSWYFMVNYSNTQIFPEAWYTWTDRGKQLNTTYSLGTVRFDPREATRQAIMKRARADEFNPNVVSSREDALARIEEMKRSGSAGS